MDAGKSKNNSVDKHKVWLVAGIAIVIVAVAFLILYPMFKGEGAVAGQATKIAAKTTGDTSKLKSQMETAQPKKTEQKAPAPKPAAKAESKSGKLITPSTPKIGSSTAPTIAIKFEICTNNIDDDLNGKVDCADSGCNGMAGNAEGLLCEFGEEKTCNDVFDNDRDGIVAATIFGTIDVGGITVQAADVYAAVSGNIAGRGTKITRDNIDAVEETIEIGDISELDHCKLINCNIFYLENDLALITTSEGMQVIETSGWNAFPTTKGTRTPTQMKKEVVKPIPVVVESGQSVEINAIAQSLSTITTTFKKNILTGMAVRISSTGTDCEDSDCDDDPNCNPLPATSSCTKNGDCGSGKICKEGACVTSTITAGDIDNDGIVDTADVCKSKGKKDGVYTTGSLKGCPYGDINNDGCVNFDDVSQIALNVNFNCINGQQAVAGDINSDKCVNFDDVSQIALNVNFNCQ